MLKVKATSSTNNIKTNQNRNAFEVRPISKYSFLKIRVDIIHAKVLKKLIKISSKLIVSTQIELQANMKKQIQQQKQQLVNFTI